ncbi:hypothetical protein F66182_650 [Fusarium sp. NRRL 66182]|nr:hypothetical protein F66182_650 [Fusarium sp. NRRL 66182]
MTLNQAAPTSVAANPSNAGSYFTTAIHKTQSTETTPVSSPGLKAEFDSGVGAKPIPVLNRVFPKPLDEVDVQAMLDRHPGRWTIQGQMEANQRRAKPVTNEEELKARRLEELEKAKQDLRAFHGNLHHASGPWRP